MKYYEIYDALTEELLAKGTSRECVKKLGCSSPDTFYCLVNRSKNGKNKQYRVIIVEGGKSGYPVLGKHDPEYHNERE